MAWSREHGARSTEHGREERLEMTLWVILVKEPVCRGGFEHGARSMEHGAWSKEQGAQSKEHRARSTEH